MRHAIANEMLPHANKVHIKHAFCKCLVPSNKFLSLSLSLLADYKQQSLQPGSSTNKQQTQKLLSMYNIKLKYFHNKTIQCYACYALAVAIGHDAGTSTMTRIVDTVTGSLYIIT